MIEVGSYWRHGDLVRTVWTVVDGSSSKRERNQGCDILLRLVWISRPSASTVPVGGIIDYWSRSMISANSWTRIEEEDIPLVLLGGL